MNRVLTIVITLALVFTWTSIATAQTPRKDSAQDRFSTTAVIDNQHSTAGVSVSAAFINGFPAVVYSDIKTRKLMFAIAKDRVGTSWEAPVEISSTPNTGIWCSLTEVNERPAVAYYQHEPNAPSSVLIFRRALDRRGRDWGTTNTNVIVHRGSRTGKMLQMITVANNPAIVWYSDRRPARGLVRPHGTLYYTRATDMNGETWASPVMIDYTGDSGLYPSIAIVANRPAVAYFDRVHCGLKYSIARDEYGYSWNRPKLIGFRYGEIQGEYPSLAVVDGNPAIAFYNRTHNATSYMRARDRYGKRWERARFIDKDNVCGAYPTLVMNNDHPQVAYYARRLGSERGEIRLASALDATGLHWGTPTSVTTMIDLPAPVMGITNKSFAGIGKAALFTFGNKVIVVSRTVKFLSAFQFDK